MDELPTDTMDTTRARGAARIRTGAATILTVAFVIFALREGGALIAPVLVSVLLAYALEPAVALLTRCGLRRGVAVIFVSAALIAGSVATARLARHQLAGFLDTLPAIASELKRTIERTRAPGDTGPGPMAQLQHAATDLEVTLGGPAPPPSPNVARVVPVSPPFNVGALVSSVSMTLAATAARLFGIALLTLMLLLTGERLKRKLIAMAGPRAQQKVSHDVITSIDRQIERYLFARVLISVIVAAATSLGLWALGVRQPFVLGLIAGVLNVMPFIGPAAAVALIAFVAFAQFHTLTMTAWAAAVAGAIAILEGNLISPWLTGRAAELNTVAVFVSVLFWGWMWDVWGLVLAIPIMVAIKAAADHIEPLQPIGELLGR